jgi:hypothetical protein
MNKITFFIVLYASILTGQTQPWPTYSVKVSKDHPKGYYFFQAINTDGIGKLTDPCQMIVNGEGSLVYFKTFLPSEWSGDFKIQPNGLMSYNNDLRHKVYMMNKDFMIIDSLGPKNGLTWDFHEFQVLENGHYLFLATETVTMDLSKYKAFNKKNDPGSDTAKVLCWVVQELDAAKNVVFEWHSKDYYDFKDMDEYYLSKPYDVDIVHINSVTYDTDGNLLISARNFNEVTKVNRSNGNIMWRLGGKRNQFKFVNDSTMFIGQHCPRRMKNGNLILLDNGRKEKPFHPTIAKEYKLDEKNLKATLVWSYTDKSDAYSNGYGNVDKIKGDYFLIDYGKSINSTSVFNVVRSSGEIAFELGFRDTLKSYRTFYYPSLPWNLNRPMVYATTKKGKTILTTLSAYADYKWSNGETTRSIEVSKPGTYTVFIPIGNGGFIGSLPFKVTTPGKEE